MFFKQNIVGRSLAALVLFASMLVADASAMSVEPMVLEVSSVGSGSQASFKVTNRNSASLPVEISVSRMEIGSDGEPSYVDASDELLIYPPQANISKGSAQTFRVQWLGDPEINASRNYRLAVAQVPLKMPEGQSGIQITMSFGVVVGVSPPEGKAAIVAGSAKSTKAKDGKPAIALSVKNPGNKHAYMRDAAIDLSAPGWSQKLTAYEVGQKVGLGIVQPGKERRFVIPLDVPPGVSDITASINYQPEK